MTSDTQCGKLFEDGAELVLSLKGVWTGSGWSSDWREGLKFRPCTGFGLKTASELTAKEGHTCFTAYVAPNQP